MYLVAIIDWYSRFIVGWSLSNVMKTDFIIRAIKEAIKEHGKPEIINSDQGTNLHLKITSTVSKVMSPLTLAWTVREEQRITPGQNVSSVLTNGRGIIYFTLKQCLN
jgi:hypothetical protein